MNLTAYWNLGVQNAGSIERVLPHTGHMYRLTIIVPEKLIVITLRL